MFKINESESTDVILGLAEVHYFPIYCIGNTFNEHRNVKETVLNLEEYFSKLDQKENFNELNVSACLDHNNNQSKFALYFIHLHNKINFFFKKVSNLQILIQKLSYQILDIQKISKKNIQIRLIIFV